MDGLGDPILLCEVDNDPLVFDSSNGPGMGREVGLSSVGEHTNFGLRPTLKGEFSTIGLAAQVNFGDISVHPELIPPAGFAWKFSEGVWALFPEIVGRGVIEANEDSDQDQAIS